MRSLKNEERKREKSLEKSKNVLEEKCKMVKRKNCTKKDQHVYNKCYELCSRAIKNCCPKAEANLRSEPGQSSSHEQNMLQLKKKRVDYQ